MKYDLVRVRHLFTHEIQGSHTCRINGLARRYTPHNMLRDIHPLRQKLVPASMAVYGMPRLSSTVVQELLDEMNRLVVDYPVGVERTGESVSALIEGTACFP